MTATRIKLEVAKYFRRDLEVFSNRSRERDMVIIRQIAHYLCRKLTLLSFSEIGKEIGGLDHSTVLSSCRQVQNMIYTKDRYNGIRIKDMVMEIEKNIFSVTIPEDHCRHAEMIENAFVFC